MLQDICHINLYMRVTYVSFPPRMHVLLVSMERGSRVLFLLWQKIVPIFFILLALITSGSGEEVGTTRGKSRRGSFITVSPAVVSADQRPTLASIVATPVPSAVTTSLGYGEYCNEARGLVCNSRALLKCVRSRCVCSRGDDLIFDMVRGQCVAKAGAKCTFVEQGEGPRTLPCVLNAVCNGNGVCQCSPRFYNSLNVTCIPQKSFDAYCHFDTECREDHHLRCIAGRCQCDPAVSIKHRKYELCLSLAGESALDGNCIEFTERVSLTPRSPLKCECQVGHVRGPDKKCHGTYGRPCTIDSPCQEHFSCVQGTCQCPAQEYQSYYEEKDQCRSKAFGPCNQNSDCIPQAFCNTTGLHSRCECREGFIVGRSRNCEKSIGSPCDIFPPTGNETLEECSNSARLICIDGRCTCPAMRVYSDKFEKCVGLADSICVNDKEPLPICIENSECIYKFERLGFGLCMCRAGSRMTRARRCVPLDPVKAPTVIDEEETEEAMNITLGLPPTRAPTTTTTTTTTTPVPKVPLYTPLLPENVDIEKLKNDTKNKHLWEFFVFLNETLHGNFNNASFKRFMKKDWFRLPD